MMKLIFLKIRHKNRRAETILEVLVAIFIVAIGSMAATSLITDAMRSNGLSRDNLIALNLAVEATEAVRAIRDGNWLKYSFDRDNCWNMMPDKSVCNPPDDLIPNGNFTAYLDTSTMGWQLVKSEAAVLNLDNPGAVTSNEVYRLHLADANDSFDSDGNETKDDDRDLYVAATSGLPKTPSRFYRMVSIDYNNNGNPANEKEMTVTCIVQWQFRGTHQVKLVTKLTDYLRVKRT